MTVKATTTFEYIYRKTDPITRFERISTLEVLPEMARAQWAHFDWILSRWLMPTSIAIARYLSGEVMLRILSLFAEHVGVYAWKITFQLHQFMNKTDEKKEKSAADDTLKGSRAAHAFLMSERSCGKTNKVCQASCSRPPSTRIHQTSLDWMS